MSTFLSERAGVVGRKAYRCVLCGQGIPKGSLHCVRNGVTSDGFWVMRMHPECQRYETQCVGAVDPEWYEDTMDSAFYRSDAISFVESQTLKITP